MRARRDFDVFPPVFGPMRDGDDDWNAKIARYVQRPDVAAHRGEDGAEVAHIAVAELVEIDLRTAQTVVPPDCICVALDEFEEPLKDGFLDRIARRASVRIGADLIARSRIRGRNTEGRWERI